MKRMRGAIQYRLEATAKGARVRITTKTRRRSAPFMNFCASKSPTTKPATLSEVTKVP